MIKSVIANRRGFLRRLSAAFAGTTVATTGATLAMAKDDETSSEPRIWSPRGPDPFVGEIAIVGFNFAPRGWAKCEGQILPIAQNQSLFSLLGTTYGGDGRTSFALPDLRGRVPMGTGRGPGLTSRRWGEKGGDESVTLTTSNMPSHNHPVTSLPGAVVRGTGSQVVGLASGGDAGVVGVSAATDNNGGSQPHSVVQPFLSLCFVIALVGAFPPRN